MESKKDKIVQLLNEGKSFKAIAKEVGCSTSTVSFHASKLRISPSGSKSPIEPLYASTSSSLSLTCL